MKPGKGSYRIAIVGASSLFGKELATVLKERHFPVSRLIRFPGDEDELELPILDLQDNAEGALGDEGVTASDLDFAFLAARPRELPSFLRGLLAGGKPGRAPRCVVIDLAEGLSASPAKAVLSIAFLDPQTAAKGRARAATRIVSAHPATIVISTLLLRLGARIPLNRAVVQVFSPASQLGSRAIEELQKQTVNLLSFQDIPRVVFGTQLAFNVVPRLGRDCRSSLAELEGQVRWQLAQYLGKRVPLPALHIVQTPVFYALAISLYVETSRPAPAKEVARPCQRSRRSAVGRAHPPVASHRSRSHPGGGCRIERYSGGRGFSRRVASRGCLDLGGGGQHPPGGRQRSGDCGKSE
jgi:aspartate-semialdehyde dehydrogenase